jgi:NAD(P)H-dependent FMN reductase
MPVHIIAISGSQRENSWSTALLRATRQLAPSNMFIDIVESHKSWPLFNPDLEAQPPEPVRAMRQSITECDGLLIASPEYAHGVTGTIKNALDWLVGHPPVAGMPVGIFNPSYQSYHADEALKETLRTMSVVLVPDACVRIPVIGSGIEQAGIADSPRFAPLIRAALDALMNACSKH